MAKTSSRMVNGEFFQDDKFLSRLLSREKYNSSKQGESSFRVLYYAGATGSVPFVWESQPGTPKHKSGDSPLPPLSPPPQYQSSPQANPSPRKHSKISRSFKSMFARVASKKINASPLLSPPPPPSSSPSLSYSYSLPSTPFNPRKSNSKARSRSTIHFGLDEDEFEPDENSPTSALRFGPRNGSPSRKFKGYSCTIKSVKKVVGSIVGHGTSN